MTDPAVVEQQAAELDRQAALLRENPPASEAAERHRRAADLEREATHLRERLAADLRARKAANVEALGADLVRVRWLRDGSGSVDGRNYRGRGPVRQRLGQPPTHTSTVAPEVELQPGEEQVMPRADALVLGAGGVDGYVEILGPAAEANA